MKKVFALLLALCLLCGTALADNVLFAGRGDPSDKPSGDTTVQLTVNDSYEITIPSTIELKTPNYMNVGQVKLTKCIIAKGNTLKVSISTVASSEATENTEKVFKLMLGGTDAAYSVPYSIKVGTGTAYTKLPEEGILVLQYPNGGVAVGDSVNVTFALTSQTFPVSGGYSDTVTFAVTNEAPEEEVAK